MTIIDYLLLAGLFAASIYTIYRLFLGWLHSPSNEARTDGAETARSGAAPMSAMQSRARTGAPWQPRRPAEGRSR